MNHPAAQPSASAKRLRMMRSRNSSRCSTNVARNSSGSSEEFRLTFHQGVFAMARNYLLFEDERVLAGHADELSGRGRATLHTALPAKAAAALAAHLTARDLAAAKRHATATPLLEFRIRRRGKNVIRAADPTAATRAGSSCRRRH